MRQMAAAEMMIAMNRFSLSYVKSIVAATPADEFVEGTLTFHWTSIAPQALVSSANRGPEPRSLP